MAKAIRFEWNLKGFQQLRRSPGVKSKLKSEADAVSSRAGSGYETRTGEGKTRSRASVVTVTPEAMRDNSENNSLLRALGGG